MPTPVKYYNPEIRRAFGEIEQAAARSIADTLPEDLKADYAPLLDPDETEELTL